MMADRVLGFPGERMWAMSTAVLFYLCTSVVFLSNGRLVTYEKDVFGNDFKKIWIDVGMAGRQ